MLLSNVKWFTSKEEVPYDVRAQLSKAVVHGYVGAAAVMPDVHLGYGLPIGTVVQTTGYINPSWVGFDIGCGVACIKLDMEEEDLVTHKWDILQSIAEEIPIMAGDEKPFAHYGRLTAAGQDVWKARGGGKQLGTLGGGNHFIEIGKGTVSGGIFCVIHTGSRGFGHGICSEYDHKGYPLLTRSQRGQAYLNDYDVATEYAKCNRVGLFTKVKKAIEAVTNKPVVLDWDTLINKTHNSVELEYTDTWITRKGATSADWDEWGVIPGNMKDGSFITKGLGNRDSLYSCAHGAGRVLSRDKAKSKLSLEKFEEEMEDSKIAHCPITKRTLAEAPKAYKDIFKVLNEQMGTLLSVEERVLPVVNFKG